MKTWKKRGIALRRINHPNAQRKHATKKLRVVCLALNSISLISWVFSVFQGRLNIEQGISDLGLVSILPLTFFISVSLLTISFLTTLKFEQQNKLSLFSQIALLIFFLNFTPAIIEGTPRFSGTYSNYQSIDYILQNGYLSPSDQWIHNWPGFSVAYSTLIQITTLPEQPLLSMYSTFFNTILFFPLYIFFNSVIGHKGHKWIAIWVFYITNWIGQDYFSMQSLGFFTFVLILFTMFKQVNSPSHGRPWSIISMLLFSLLTLTHMLSSLAVLVIILMFFISKCLRKSRFLLLFGLLFVLWTIQGAATYFECNFVGFITQALKFELIFQSNIVGRVAGSPARVTVTQIRLLFSSFVALFAFTGAILTWKQRKSDNVEKEVLLVFIGLSSLLFLSAYGGEIILRLYLFSLVPLVYFASKGSNWRIFFGVLAIFLVVVAPPLYFITRYGNEVMDYVPPSEITGVQFFYNRTTQGIVIGGFRDLKHRNSSRLFSLSHTVWKDSVLSLGWIDPAYRSWPRFVCISYGIRERCSFAQTLGKIGMVGLRTRARMVGPEFITELYENISRSISYDKVYSNPSFDLYLEMRHSR